MTPTSEQFGGVVLCGGASSRMGLPKAWLPFGDETMLQRVVRVLGQAVRPIVVVAAPNQRLPDLPAETIVARDAREGRGPLAGLWAGLNALPGGIPAAYATGCDVPLLVADFVRSVCGRLAAHDVAVPVDGDRHHPLAAVYRTRVSPRIAALLAADRLRPVHLFEQVDTLRIPVSDLQTADPRLDSLANLNQPRDYAAALALTGRKPPADIARRLGLDQSQGTASESRRNASPTG